MSRVIRIGTRDSELALWQANTIQEILEELGHKTTLVPVKSTGDLNLNTPIYELGITGVFTRTLDIAMLNDDIDIAVHSLKDVPTTLPKGIVQAAVIKRGNVRDTLVFKKNEEFLAQRDAVIATGSLRRRAQWLHRYPTHTIVGLRGNVNTRLQKLEDNDDWNGAIFAAAGIGRLDIRPEDAVNLEWMIPAPAQGAIMITALENDDEIKAICAEINHEETEICTNIEREFLRLLEGGCTAPIGALAYIKDEKLFFQGALLSADGGKKIEVTREVELEDKDEVAQWCADYIVERGGKRMMDDIKRTVKQTNIYSTKALTEGQLQLMNNDIIIESTDFIQIKFNRMSPHLVKSEIRNVIITSKNSVESLTTSFSADQLQFKNIYCVGRRTKKLIENKIGKVTHSERNAKRLAEYLVDHLEGTEVTYFCGDLRLDDLPSILKKNHIAVNEIEAYQTAYASKKIDAKIEGVMFYSPSTVQSFILENTSDKIAFCIGESTANEAKKHFKDVRISKVPTVESVIELVNEHYL